MTAANAVARAGAVYPEVLSDERVYSWLSELEERIFLSASKDDFSQISAGNGSRELLAPDHLADVYPLYIIAKFDLSNADHSRYICHNSAFMSAYSEVLNYFTRSSNEENCNYYKLL